MCVCVCVHFDAFAGIIYLNMSYISYLNITWTVTKCQRFLREIK